MLMPRKKILAGFEPALLHPWRTTALPPLITGQVHAMGRGWKGGHPGRGNVQLVIVCSDFAFIDFTYKPFMM